MGLVAMPSAMPSSNDGSLLPFEDAVFRSLQMAGADVMRTPVRFLSYVTDLCDHSQRAFVVFSRNCDEELLVPFLASLHPTGESELRLAANKCAETLSQGRGIDEEAARSCAEGIAAALARCAGVSFERSASVSHAAAPAPIVSNQNAATTQPVGAATPASGSPLAHPPAGGPAQTMPATPPTHVAPAPAVPVAVPQPRRSSAPFVVAFLACVAAVVALVCVLVVLPGQARTEGDGKPAEQETQQANANGTSVASEDNISKSEQALEQDANDDASNDAVGDEAGGGANALGNGVAVQTGLDAYSWEDLAQIGSQIAACGSRADALALAQDYNLAGSGGKMYTATKEVRTTDGQTLNMRIVDVWHDEASTSSGRAGLTFLATNSAHRHPMSDGKYTVGGWEGSSMRAWMSSTLLGTFPSDLQGAIVPVYKWSNNVGEASSTSCVTQTTDRLWIPSIVELAGQVSWTFHTDPGNSGLYSAVFNAEGYQYAAFEQLGIVDDNNNGALVLSGGNWWLRSTAASTGRGRFVTEGGDPSGFGDSFENWQVVVGFCL